MQRIYEPQDLLEAELLCAMLALEAFFGVAGLVAAPVAYAWLKAEMKIKNLI